MIQEEQIKEAIDSLNKHGIQTMRLAGIENKTWWINSETINGGEQKPWGLYLDDSELIQIVNKIKLQNQGSR